MLQAVAQSVTGCRLQRIKDIAGPSGQDDAALDALMKGDFDPEQYDKQMAAAFGDEYYGVRSSFLSTCPLQDQDSLLRVE